MVRYTNGQVEDVSPLTTNVRTRVHEYGGAAFVPIFETMVAISEFSDQKLYTIPLEGKSATKKPRSLSKIEGCRYADGVFDPESNSIFTVRYY